MSFIISNPVERLIFFASGSNKELGGFYKSYLKKLERGTLSADDRLKGEAISAKIKARQVATVLDANSPHDGNQNVTADEFLSWLGRKDVAQKLASDKKTAVLAQNVKEQVERIRQTQGGNTELITFENDVIDSERLELKYLNV